MSFVKHVRSTLKGGCDVWLGQRTVIYGPNGGGKSTIVQSIELATSGWVTDMEGKDQVKRPQDLSRLFPPDSSMRAEVTLDDGKTFLWKLEPGQKKGSFKRPTESQPVEVAWPLRDLEAILSGDSAVVGSWLERQIGGENLKEDLLRRVPPHLREATAKYLDRHGSSDFLGVAKEAKSEARKLRAAATRREGTLDSIIEGVAPPMLASDRTEMDARMAAMREEITDSSCIYVTAAEKTKLHDQLKAKVEKYVVVEAQLTSLTVNPKLVEALDRLTAAVKISEEHQNRFKGDVCWVCGEGSPEAINHNLGSLREARTALEKKTENFDRMRTLQQEATLLEIEMEGMASRLKKMVIGEDPRKSNQKEREEILKKLAADDVAKKAWNNVRAQKAEIQDDRNRADVLAAMGKVLDKVGKELVEEKKADFENRVNAYLPEGERIGINLKVGRLGIKTEAGPLRTALSGAEWSRLLLALASLDEGSSTPSVLVPKDRAWDRDTLGRVMQALSTSPSQVIIMSTVKPDPVEGWNLIDLTE